MAVYRVTKIYPGGEVLIYKTREIANGILSDFVLGNKKSAGRKIEIILNYLRIAQDQEWIKQVNFMVLSNGYGELIDELKAKEVKKDKELEDEIKINRLKLEQKRILKYAGNKEKFKFKDIKGLFPEKSPRTIRVYLNEMVRDKILIQKGRGRSSFYQINKAINKEI